MTKWSKKESPCKNCKTRSRKHTARGYCVKCYRLVYAKEKIKLLKLDSFLRSNKSAYLWRNIDNRIFEKAKILIINQVNDRLQYLKFRESKLQNNVEGLDLEFTFNWLAKQAGVRENIFHGMAGWFEMTFNNEQRKKLMRQIDKIQQSTPWGVNWPQALFVASDLPERDVSSARTRAH